MECTKPTVIEMISSLFSNVAGLKSKRDMVR